MKTMFTKRLVTLCVLMALVCGGVVAQPTVLGTQLANGSYTTYDLNTVGVFKQYRLTATSGANIGTRNWLFASGTAANTVYGPTWRPQISSQVMSTNNFIPTSYDNGAKYNASGGQDGLLPTINSGSYYTFNVTASPTLDNSMELLETGYNPTTLSGLTKTPANVTSTSSVTVSTIASNNLATGEYLYLRYSTVNTFATSTVVAFALSSGTTYTATIPAQANGTTIYYYAFTSNKTATQLGNDVGSPNNYGQTAYDMATLNVSNNSNSNYNFTVTDPVTVTSTGGTSPSATYPTFASALTAINGGTIHTGTIVCSVNAGYSEIAPSGGFVITATGTASNTIKFVKSGAGTNPIFTAPATWTSNSKTDAVFKIIGGDYITIDGFTIQENAANTTITSGSNNMTEFGIGIFLKTTGDGAQNNTIQNCTISLGSSYYNAIGIFSSSASSESNGALAASSTAGTNSNNKFYGNTISNVAYGMYFISPQVTTTIFETGIDIGGTSSATANTILFGNATTSDLSQTSFSAALEAGIYFRNNIGNSVRYNNITSNSLIYLQSAGLGGVVYANGSNPSSGVTYTSTISNNTINLTNNGVTPIIAIDFGSGLSTGTIVGSSNTITLTQTATAAYTAAVTGVKASYTSATNTCSSNNVTINQTNNSATSATLSGAVTGVTVAGVSGTSLTASSNTVVINQATSGAGSISSATTGVSLASTTTTITGNSNNITINQTGAGTGTLTTTLIGLNISGGATTNNALTNTIVFNQTTSVASGITTPITGIAATVAATTLNITTTNAITVKQAVSGSGTYGSGAITYIDLGTVSHGTANVVSNTLNTTGSTIRSTGTLIGVQCNGSASLYNIKSNTANMDRVATSGAIYFTYQTSSPSNVADTVSNNNITFTNLATSGTITAISQLGGLSTSSKSIYNNTINISGSTTTTSLIIGINFGYAAGVSVSANSITIAASSPSVYGIWTATGVATGTANNIANNTFNITSATASATTLYAIYASVGGNFQIFGNTINSLAYTGVLTNGGQISAINCSIGSSNNIYNNTITGLSSSVSSSTTSPLVDGILISGATAVNVYQNKIYGLTTAATGAGVIDGIKVSSGTTINIYNNLIGGLTSSATSGNGVLGINLTSTTSSSNINVYYNTVYLNATSLATNSTALYHTTSTTSTTAALALLNNIFVNASTVSSSSVKAVAYQRSSTTTTNFASSNNNDFVGTSGIYYDGTNTPTTIADYRTVVGSAYDAASFIETPNFISTSGANAQYLHINTSTATRIESGGSASLVSTYTKDYDGDTRQGSTGYSGAGTKPDVGADEFAGTPAPNCTAPASTSLAVSATVSATSTSTISGSFIATNGTAPTGYVVVRSTSSTTPTLITGTTYAVGSSSVAPGGYIEYVGTGAGSWTSTSLTAGTPYYYFVFSYNNTVCLNGPAYSTTATTANATTLSCPVAFNTVISIGSNTTVAGSSYQTLTAAIADLTACSVGITQATTLELNASYDYTKENFPIILGSITGASSTNTLTIRPAAGTTQTITASNNTAVFNISGGKYWIIDGRAGGTGSTPALTVSNTNTAGGSAIQLVNDAVNNTVRYTTLKALYPSLTSGIVTFGAGISSGNNNNAITSCNIDGGAGTAASPTTVAITGIYSNGLSSTVLNSNNAISNNNIYDLFGASASFSGVDLGANNASWPITGNKIYQTNARTYTTGTTSYGVFINAANTGGFTVNNNTIGFANSSSTGTMSLSGGTNGFQAIYINVLVSSAFPSSVQGNTVSGISLNSTSSSTLFAGVNVVAGTVNIGNTTGNTIGNTTSTGAISITSTSSGSIYGISASSTGTVQILNNNIGSISTSGAAGIGYTFYGIITAGTAGNFTINGNTIGGNVANSIIIGTDLLTTATNTIYGITNAATGTIVIGASGAGNTLQNISNFTIGTNYIYGIYNSAASSSLSMAYNSVSAFATGWSTTSGSGQITCLSNLGTVTGTCLINNNTISSITNLNTTSTIYLINGNSSTTTYTVANNTANNVSRASGLAGTIYGFYNNGSPTGGTATLSNNSFTNITAGGSTSSFYGIHSTTSTSQNVNYTGNTVSGITAGSGNMYGIYNTYGTTVNISGNTITGFSGAGNIYGVYAGSSSTTNCNTYSNAINTLSTSGSTGVVYGVYIGASNTSAASTCYKNKITDLSATSNAGTTAAAYGVYVAAGTTVTVHNNIIGGLTSATQAATSTSTDYLAGIYVASTTTSSTVNVYYNTVYLSASTLTTNSAAVYAVTSSTATTAALSLINNIFVNNSTFVGSYVAAAYQRSNSTLTNYATSSNNNDFYGTSGLYYDGVNTPTTLGGYQGIVTSTRDAASVNENPTFVSTNSSDATYLHINTSTPTNLESGGKAVSGYTTDYDGDIRAGNTGYTGSGNASDIGADEFNGIPISGLITLGSNNIPAGNIAQGSTNSILYSFSIAASGTNATLTGLTATTAGTYLSTDVTNLKVWYQTTSTFTGTGTLLSTLSVPGAAGLKTFPSFTSQTVSAGSTGYIFITADLPCGATVGNTISVNAITSSNTTFTSGTVTGTPSLGNTQTIIAATPINATSFTASVANASSILSWTAPAGCYDEVMIIATAGAANNGGTPTGNGSAYTGNLAYGSGTAFGNGYVVYKGTASPETITNLTNGTTYYFKIFTRFGTKWSAGTEVSVTPALVYCTPTYTTGGSTDNITNVSLTGTIGSLSNNTSASGNPSPYYVDYTSQQPGTIGIPSLQQGSSYTLSISFGTDANQYNGVWIDFNQNGVFETSEFFTSNTNTAGSGTASVTITVPVGATLGNTRMRIRGGDDSQPSSSQACGASNSGYGEAEDYLITVITAPNCTGYNGGTALASATSFCSSGSTTLSATGYSTGTTASYQWEYSTDNTNWNTLTGQTNPASASTGTITTTTYYRLKVTCSAVGQSGYSTVVMVTVNNPLVATTTPAARCGAGTVTLVATPSAGATINWYSASMGGTVLATGNSYTTPSLSSTTPFYAEASIGTTANVGPFYSGTSTNGSNVGNHGILFTNTDVVTINSVDIPFTGTGTFTISLATISSGNTVTPISSVTTSTVTGSGTTSVTVPLNLTVSTPGNYGLIVTGVSGTISNLGYAAASYPYSGLGGKFSITNGFWYSPTSSNMYLFNLNVTAACVSGRTSVTATINSLPTVSLTNNAGNPACINTPITYTTDASQSNYVWTFSGTQGTDYTVQSGTGTSTSNTAVVTWLTSGSKTVTANYTNSNGCTAATATSSTLTISGAEAVTLDAGSGSASQDVCPGSSITAISYTVSGSATGISFSNIPSGLTTTISNSGKTLTISGIPTSGGTYTVAASGGCGTSNLSGTITILAAPIASFGSTGPFPTCYGTQIDIPISGTANSTVTYKVDGSGSFTASIGSGGTGSIRTDQTLGNSTTTTTHTFTLVGVKNNTTGCTTSISGSATVRVDATPTLAAANGSGALVQTICKTNALTTITYNVGGSATGYTITGTFPTGITPSTGGTTATISGTVSASATSGTYNFTITTTGGSCTGVPVSGSIIVPSYFTWTGNNGTNWNAGGNWCSGTVPSSTDDVVIPTGLTNYPVLPGNITVNNVTIQPGATVNNGGFTLTANSVTGSGSITGSATSNLVVNATSTLNFTTGANLLHYLTVNGGTVTLGNALNITGGTNYGIVTVASGATLVSNGLLTLKSDANGTAAVAANTGSSSYITGNVTVERYTDAATTVAPLVPRRAWRFLSPTVTGTTINAAWQEGSLWDGTGSNLPTGRGTLITGYTQGSAATANGNGYDFWSAIANSSSSIRSFQFATGTTTTGSWLSLSSIKNKDLGSENAYMLFVRGDRSITTGAGATTLRATGTLKQLGQTYSVDKTKSFIAAGNPYPSTIDWSSIFVRNQSFIQDKFVVWDSKRSTYGAYVLVQGDETGNYYAVPLLIGGTGTTNNLTRFIPSGAGFFVYPKTGGSGTSNLQILEADKNAAQTAATNPFRLLPDTDKKLWVNLNLKDSDTSATLADGLLARFDASYDTTVNDDDAQKVTNFNENLGIVHNDLNLMVEARKEVEKSDTLHLKLWNVTQRAYQLQVVAANWVNSSHAWLEDHYLQTKQELSLTGSVTTVDFSVNGDAASSASDRFDVVFQNDEVLPVMLTSVKAAASNGGVQVNWTVTNEVNIKQYTIERSTDGGATYTTLGTQAAKNNSGAALTSYDGFDAAPKLGDNLYRIRIEAKDGTVTYSQIVKVTIGGNGGILITMYPNPVRQNGKVNLQLSNLAAGNYLVSVFSEGGQSVYQKKITIAQPNAVQSEELKLGAGLAQGSYQVRITNSKGAVLFLDKLVVGR